MVVRAALVCDLLSDLIKALLTFLPHFVHHLGNFGFRVDPVEAISGQDQHVVALVDLMERSLWLRNNELLVADISDCSADCHAAIHSCDVVTEGDQAIVVDDPVVFILSRRCLVHRQPLEGSVLLQQHGG